MSDRPPWIKPAITFGIPLLALVVGLPYLTGNGYHLPSTAGLATSLNDTRRAVAHAVAGDGAGPSAKVRFYECASATGRILSDTPCGVVTRVRDIDPAAVSHFKPPPPVVAGPATSATQARGGSPVAILGGVREDLAAASSLDERRRATAERDAE